MTATDASLNLDAIRRRADAATPGPWAAVTDNGRKDGIGIVGQLAKRGTGEAIAVFAGVGGRRHADATFAAHAREDVPRLLLEVDALRGRLAAVRQVCTDALADPGDTNGGVWEDPTPIPGWTTVVLRAAGEDDEEGQS